MAWTRYPAYRDSGVAWLGEVPAEWEITKLKYVAELRSGHTPSRNHPEYWENCTIPWVSLADVWQLRNETTDYIEDTEEKISELGLANSAAVLLPERTVILSRTASVGFAGIITRPMATTQDYVNWTCGPRLIPEYLLYVFRSMREEFDSLTMGSVHRTIYFPDVLSFKTPLPSIQEQQAIVDFVRGKVSRIDALLAKKEGLIALLQEKRAALISHAVTKGLDPTAPMMDSGIAWLGDVPAHWETLKLTRVASLHSGHTPSRLHPEYWENCTIPWISLGDVWQLRSGRMEYIKETKEKISELGLRNSSAELLPGGTVILSRTASVGFSGIMATSMATTQDYANWVCGPRMLPEYLLQVLRCMKQEFDRLTMGSTHQTIYMPDIEAFRVPLPPIEEQQEIIEYARSIQQLSERLEDAIAESIRLAKEYRTTLITAAVTGEIDVRGEVPA